MSNRIDEIRRDRLSEIDDIMDLFPGKLSLDDILNQDYSLITDLASVRDEKNTKFAAEQAKKLKKPNEPLMDKMPGNKK